MIKALHNGAANEKPWPSVTMTTVADPEEIARARAQQERAERNAQWLQAHAADVFQHRGKYFCIAGQELFLADTAAEAWALGEAAHPDDDGMFVRYIPKDRLPRIYAHRRPLVSV